MKYYHETIITPLLWRVFFSLGIRGRRWV